MFSLMIVIKYTQFDTEFRFNNKMRDLSTKLTLVSSLKWTSMGYPNQYFSEKNYFWRPNDSVHQSL